MESIDLKKMEKQTKQTKIGDIKLVKRQHCTTCNRYVRVSSRYPDYACLKCQKLAVNKEGQRVEYFNVSADGHGCQGVIVDGNKLTRSKICFIKGVRFRVEEAHLGGLVFLPFPESQRKAVKRKKSV